ncbi:MAG: subclass B3 metallo-beta-lactamase [Gemmatimonas sp.]|nr:subclass B3 metallo-beta-lactamase [Gemmatimonas sp.]
MRSIVIALLLTPSMVQGQNSDWTEPIEPFGIADDLHYVGTAGLSAYLLTSEEGHILIDAPLQENVPLVLDNIRELGFSPSDVRIQLTSHAHFDHVGGLADMIEATGADLVVSPRDAEYIQRGADFGLETAGYPSVAPARTISHLETVRLGGVELTAHLTPGHTPGCTTWSGSVEIAGEPYTFVSVCSLSVLSTYRIVGEEPTYAGQAEDYCRSVAHLRSLDPDIFLGAHGSWFGLEEKITALRAGDLRAFVASDRYGSYLDSAEERIEEVLAEQGHSGGCASLVQ